MKKIIQRKLREHLYEQEELIRNILLKRIPFLREYNVFTDDVKTLLIAQKNII